MVAVFGKIGLAIICCLGVVAVAQCQMLDDKSIRLRVSDRCADAWNNFEGRTEGDPDLDDVIEMHRRIVMSCSRADWMTAQRHYRENAIDGAALLREMCERNEEARACTAALPPIVETPRRPEPPPVTDTVPGR
jgi:hypothetical protein